MKEADCLKISKSPRPVCVCFVVLKEVEDKASYLDVKQAAFRVYGDFAKTFGKSLLAFHPDESRCRADVTELRGLKRGGEGQQRDSRVFPL